ncbi:MAG: YgjV family protein [Clostridia bacterium]|nr:YgjV family protein [Clostridia bacterium]
MDIKIVADIASFIAMVLIATSYFVKNKRNYLFFQLVGIVFLILSFFFSVMFVAMIGLSIGLLRTITFFIYEKKGKKAPLIWSFVFSALTIGGYFIAQAIKDTATPYDVMNIIALCMYAFIFRIRDIRVVKFTMLVPTVLSILYNLLSSAPIFNALSYTIELIANIVSIITYYTIMSRKNIAKNKKQKEE